MAWTIEFKNKCLKFLDRQDADFQNRVRDSLNKLLRYLNNGVFPFGEMDIKQLHGKMNGYMRLRVGKIRLIFKVVFDMKKVKIHTIDYRGDVYKK